MGVGSSLLQMLRRSLLLAFLLASSAAPQATTTATTAEQWRVVAIPFTSSQAYANPFLDVSFTAVFTQGNRSITRAGYWNGGRAFALRFHGPALGAWAWRTQCSNPADAGLHNVSGTLQVVPYASGANPLFVHGPLRVRGDGRRFQHADGTPFRWLGDTAWMSPDLTLLDSCNAPPNVTCASALDYIIADRLAKSFTVYQTYFFGETDTWWVPGSNYTALNATAFEARVDRVVSAATEAGLAVALGMGMHSQSVTMPLPALQALAAYTSARYGAHSIVWITAQEGAWRQRVRALCISKPHSRCTITHTARTHTHTLAIPLPPACPRAQSTPPTPTPLPGRWRRARCTRAARGCRCR